MMDKNQIASVRCILERHGYEVTSDSGEGVTVKDPVLCSNQRNAYAKVQIMSVDQAVKFVEDRS